MQCAGLTERLRKTGIARVVIGVSGGLDSTLALLVAAAAMDDLGRPRSDILGISTPGFGNSSGTRTSAEALMRGLGIEFRTIDIRPACRQHFADIGHPEDRYDVVFENAQARERTQILMDVANAVGGLVLGTSDMSELALGWATFNGDHMSMYAVNAGVPKTLVQYLVRVFGEMHPELEVVLAGVLATEISPELLPPDAAGRIQSTEAALPEPKLKRLRRLPFRRLTKLCSAKPRQLSSVGSMRSSLSAAVCPTAPRSDLWRSRREVICGCLRISGPLNPEAAPDRLRALSVQRSDWKRARRFRLPEVPSW